MLGTGFGGQWGGLLLHLFVGGGAEDLGVLFEVEALEGLREGYALLRCVLERGSIAFGDDVEEHVAC